MAETSTLDFAADLAAALDPVVFARKLGFEPDPWQAELLRCADKRVLLNCSRQAGKSTVTALLTLHTAIYRPGSLTLLLSPSLRQSGELFRKVLDFFDLAAQSISESETRLSLELVNGSRVVSLPGKEGTIRGFSGVDLLIIDEAARASDDLYYAVRPMLAVSGGRLVALSTPFGRRGFFHQEWTEGQGWRRFEVPARKCSRISPDFLAEERQRMPDHVYRSEYECEFTENELSAFSYDDVMAATEESVQTWNL